jgi:tRNA(Ile)-lysidine synthase
VQFEAAVGKGLKRSVLESGIVTLGVRHGGERLRLHPGGPHRSLKNLLQEQGIPPWRRDRLPLLWCDGALLWAEGIGLEADALAGPEEPGILPMRVAA